MRKFAAAVCIIRAFPAEWQVNRVKSCFEFGSCSLMSARASERERRRYIELAKRVKEKRRGREKERKRERDREPLPLL